jgi:small subunit ribosomal protein S9
MVKEIKEKIKKEEILVYYEAVGRRKTSVARVRLFSNGKADIIVNKKKAGDYFQTKEQQYIIEDPLKKMKLAEKFRILAKVNGGGISSQAGALRHAISRALVKFNLDFKKRLKKAGFLKRDPRMKERRKFGLKKARKAPQWSKR